MARPFLKWAGGKRQLLPEIEARLPSDIAECTTYVEPFIGGGAVLFHLLGRYDFDSVHISDLNPELTLCYRMLQADARSVAISLQGLIDSYPTDQEDRGPVYYAIRDDWNSRVEELESLSTEQMATRVAQTLFLNKTCFNGLYRVNRSGRFNTPIGRYLRPSFPNPEQLRDVSQTLTHVQAHHGSFEISREYMTPSTFAYFDPPYRPLSNTAAFTSYAKEDFNDEGQRALASFAQKLDSTTPGVRLMLSNSDPKNSDPNDDFFDDLYQGFTVERVEANRAINSDATARGSITELLITNY